MYLSSELMIQRTINSSRSQPWPADLCPHIDAWSPGLGLLPVPDTPPPSLLPGWGSRMWGEALRWSLRPFGRDAGAIGLHLCDVALTWHLPVPWSGGGLCPAGQEVLPSGPGELRSLQSNLTSSVAVSLALLQCTLPDKGGMCLWWQTTTQHLLGWAGLSSEQLGLIQAVSILGDIFKKNT